jgi:streptomycin 6-kinase
VTGGSEWLVRLPALVEELVELWDLQLEHPFEHAHVSLVAPARLPDGSQAVLKVNFPDLESEREADALAFWEGVGAVRLLAHDPGRRALLVERCVPGSTLWEIDDDAEATGIAAGVLWQLWRAPSADNFRRLEDEAARWAVELPERWEGMGRPFERSLLDFAVDFLRQAGPDQGEQVVVHQDFHGGNVLRAERAPWLAIDPKPLIGEREFDTASLLRDRRHELSADAHPERTVRRRLDYLSAELELDRERMRGWGVAHAVAWGLVEVVLDDIIACARWLKEPK